MNNFNNHLIWIGRLQPTLSDFKFHLKALLCYLTNQFKNLSTLRHTTHLHYMKIPFGKLKTIMSFPHTSNILLSPIYTLWFNVNSSKVENISFRKIRCYKALKLTNHAFMQIKKIDKTVIRSSILFIMIICEKPLNLFF